jgi:chromosome partitioning protein
MPAPPATHPAPFVLTVHGGKGGIGKTTLAQHFAWLFADLGDTLLVDADAGQQSAMDVYDRYRVDVPFDIAVENDPSTLGKIRAVSHRYVVIDAPPSTGEAEAAVEAADLVLVPIVPRVMDTRAIMRTIANIGPRPYRVVVCRVTTTMGAGRVNAVLGALAGQGVPVLNTVVREYLGPHEDALARRLPLTHPDFSTVIDGPMDGSRHDRAAYDLRSAWREVNEFVEAGSGR